MVPREEGQHELSVVVTNLQDWSGKPLELTVHSALVSVEVTTMQRVRGYASIVSSIFSGITGLIGAFAAVGKAAADQRAQMLSRNIAEAMNNTWLGLAIAATCMIGHVFLQQASKKQQQELESFSLKLENLLVDAIRDPRRAEEAPADEGEVEARPAKSGAAGRGISEARTGRPARRPAVEDEE